jgi:hypothetical protein
VDIRLDDDVEVASDVGVVSDDEETGTSDFIDF